MTVRSTKIADVPILSYVVVETKKFTLGELGHTWSGSLKACSMGSSGFFGFSGFNADGETLH
jgi:hypothetical protein